MILAHMQKVLTTGARFDPVVALMAIDTLMEIVFWHKIHQLGKNCLSEMHFRLTDGRSENMISNIVFFCHCIFLNINLIYTY